ncbi:MAG: hypothetical protein AVDCRST_MAG06-2056, partial [uncultured Nocardioides sp.]
DGRECVGQAARGGHRGAGPAPADRTRRSDQPSQVSLVGTSPL